jgi:hypothetical protein
MFRLIPVAFRPSIPHASSPPSNNHQSLSVSPTNGNTSPVKESALSQSEQEQEQEGKEKEKEAEAEAEAEAE